MRDQRSRAGMVALILALPPLMGAFGGSGGADWAAVVGVQAVLATGLVSGLLMRRRLVAPAAVPCRVRVKATTAS